MASLDGVIPAIVGAAGSGGAASAYEIERSLRFNSADTAYLNRTPSSAGNRRTWTWSGWVKRTKGAGTYMLMDALSGSYRTSLFFGAGDEIVFYLQGSPVGQLNAAADYRDFSAWYHLVFVCDTTDATATDRMKLFVNGERVTNFAVQTNPSLNQEHSFNDTVLHTIGQRNGQGHYNDGYLADVHFIDGQALDPTNFGEYDSNNVWQPKEYSGVYGPLLDQSQNWTSLLSSSAGSINNPSFSFDGNVATTSQLQNTSAGSYIQFGVTLTNVTKLEIYQRTNSDISGTGIQTYNNAPAAQWVELTLTSSTVSNIRIEKNTNDPGIHAIRVNDKLLVDSSVSIGNNSFHLDFSDNSSNAALGTDSSGNSNTWTVNNLVASDPIVNLDAVDFTSSSTRLNVPSSSNFNLGSNWTLEFFFENRSTTATRFYFFSNNAQNLQTTNNGTQLLYFNGSTAYTFGSINLNQRYHVALVNNGGTVTAYLDGVATSTFAAGTSATRSLTIGAFSDGQNAFDGKISNFRIVNGTSVYTSNFTPATSNLSNITNTVLLCCQSSSSVTAATVTPGTITATGTPTVSSFVSNGSNTDSLIDTPTNYEADSGNNGGNYATLNPVDKGGDSSATVTDGNLKWFGGTTTNHAISRSTIGVSSGKWYVEVTIEDASDTSGRDRVGVVSSEENVSITNPVIGNFSTGYGYRSDGFKENNGSSSSYGASYTTGDTIGIALDMDTGSLVFYKNGSSQGTAYTSIGGTMHFCGTPRENGTYVFNFGQRPFAYTPPTGYLSLCTTNLTDPTIADGSTAMDSTTYTGAGGTQTISGINHSPDFVWIKSRNIVDQHCLFDTVRGTLARLQSNSTNAESSINQYGSLTAFNSDGFTLTAGSSSSDQTHGNNNTYVGWTWDAGSSTVSNTDGSITSSVRANQSAGFSVVTYTGTGSLATIGHGLNAAPELILFKSRTNSENWAVYSKANGAANRLILNLNVSSAAGSNYFNNTEATSSVFTVNTVGQANGSGQNYVAYCFAPVEGYSAFGSYTGNGSADGPFIYTGFRPRFILVKITSSADDWTTIDSERIGYNDDNYWLYASSSSAEYSGSFSASDILSNGFKPRSTGNQFNANGQTYIYAAFAEHPFKTARAR